MILLLKIFISITSLKRMAKKISGQHKMKTHLIFQKLKQKSAFEV